VIDLADKGNRDVPLHVRCRTCGKERNYVWHSAAKLPEEIKCRINGCQGIVDVIDPVTKQVKKVGVPTTAAKAKAATSEKGETAAKVKREPKPKKEKLTVDQLLSNVSMETKLPGKKYTIAEKLAKVKLDPKNVTLVKKTFDGANTHAALKAVTTSYKGKDKRGYVLAIRASDTDGKYVVLVGEYNPRPRAPPPIRKKETKEAAPAKKTAAGNGSADAGKK